MILRINEEVPGDDDNDDLLFVTLSYLFHSLRSDSEELCDTALRMYECLVSHRLADFYDGVWVLPVSLTQIGNSSLGGFCVAYPV